MTLRRIAGYSFAATVIAGTHGWSQSSTQGAIGGTVSDSSGAVVPKAAIVIRNDGTNAEVDLTADNSGFFKAPLLEPGAYTVRISAAGFEDRTNKVIVQVGQVTNVDSRLGVSGSAETVQVSADVPVLNFDSPDFSSNINERAVENIPINNRRWSALALLTPGVTVDSAGMETSVFAGSVRL